jgi:hypothetical protein
MQQESKREAMWPNSFETNCVCDEGVAEERQPTRTFKEKEDEQELMSIPVEKEEKAVMLTQWEMGVKMLED